MQEVFLYHGVILSYIVTAPMNGKVPPVRCIDSTLHNATQDRFGNQAPGLPVVCSGKNEGDAIRSRDSISVKPKGIVVANEYIQYMQVCI